MNNNKNIPFCDLKREYLFLKEKIDKAVNRVLSSVWYILGREVECFEREFAGYCDSTFGIGVASGTDALHIALLACGIKPGNEIITVANAGVPTVVAIMLAGAVPVFVDIDPASYTIDVSKIEEKITDKTRIIVPVHLYGQCADMMGILKIARRHGLKVLEDACQSHGATYKGEKAGTLSDAGCFSFYPTKNLGGYGDGGMIITNKKPLAKKARLLRDYGQDRRYHHILKGLNSRLDEVQAAILRVRLKYLNRLNRRRIKIAEIYNDNINKLIIKPRKMDYGSHIYHLYVIATNYRDRLKKYLMDNGVQTIIHYPIPVYNQIAYAEFRDNNICQLTDKYSKMILSLPMFATITDEEVYYICDVINRFK